MRRSIPFLPQPEEEQDLTAYLDELPEVPEKPPLPFVTPDAPDAEVATLLATLQAETQAFVAAQFERLHAEIVGRPSVADAVELASARAELAALRDENARLLRQLDLYERALRTMRELASDVEDASR